MTFLRNAHSLRYRMMALFVAIVTVIFSLFIINATAHGAVDDVFVDFEQTDENGDTIYKLGDQNWGHFNTYLSVDTSVVDYDQAISGSKVLLIDDADEKVAPFFSVDFGTEYISQGFIEYWMMPLQTDGRMQLILDDRSADTTNNNNSLRYRIETLGFHSSGVFEYINSDGKVLRDSNSPYEANQWYRVYIEYDAEAKTKQVYIYEQDGTEVVSVESPFVSSDALGLSHFRLSTITSAYGSFYIDDISIGAGQKYDDGGGQPGEPGEPGGPEQPGESELPNLDVDFSFTVGTTEDATGLEAEEILDGSAIIHNQEEEELEVLLMVVLYNTTGGMERISHAAMTIPAGETAELHAGFKLPTDVSGYVVRALLWDGNDPLTSNMMPYSAVTELP